MVTSNQLVFVSLLAFVAMAGATQFKVGGLNGWTVPAPNTVAYNQWASKNRFQIGDSLVFLYPQGKDSVLVVDQDAYNTCNTSSYIKKFDDGNSVFTLDQSGSFFFISGIKDNCLKKESLVVIVLANRTRQSNRELTLTPPTISPPVSPDVSSSPMSPPPTGTNTSAPEPPTVEIPPPPPAGESVPAVPPSGETNPTNPGTPIAPSSEGNPNSPPPPSPNGASLNTYSIISSTAPLLGLIMLSL